ncbi:MAG TPA: AMP-binding protein [Propionicimonas sp.]|uniref:class I adenylate-forming enzyme family protein n=1 Tax=Propionicimonas sp. TaxID=1955623 RepID=UPI002F415B5E
MDLSVPDATMYELVAGAARRFPDATALIYFGRRISYRTLLADIDRCAAALASHGIVPGDSVALSMPNVPNAIVLFYALNRIGARAVMTHPLSSPTELQHYLNETGSRWAVTVDMFYGRFRDILDQTSVERLLITRFSDYLSSAKKFGFSITKGRKIAPVPETDARVLTWQDFLADAGPDRAYARAGDPAATSVVLFSGGTSALPKGIELSSASFNALAVSMREITGIAPGNSVLAILPVFHGFGLGLCIHTPLTVGAFAILVPEFSTKVYIDNLIKHSPSYIAGVPTLFQALLAEKKFARVSFTHLLGAYSGGDSLSSDLKARFDRVLSTQGSPVELMEGYGLTECVTACTVSPPGRYREGSVGIPIPGMSVTVVDSEGAEVAPGAEGEICVTGPTLMNGYLNEPDATADTLRTHDDGRTWLHTGDIGTMDADGYLYFRGRRKRIIKVSGVSVYPAQVEQVLEAHPGVQRACVIGIPDEYQMAAVKAFVIPAAGAAGDAALARELTAHCHQHLMKWAVPRSIEFRTSLPTTLVGKLAYTQLEREEQERTAAAG